MGGTNSKYLLACIYTIDVNILKVYLLYLFWPLRRITKGHEYTVGQNSTHNDHAEKSEEQVKESADYRGNDKHHKHYQTSLKIHNTAIKHLQSLYFACNVISLVQSALAACNMSMANVIKPTHRLKRGWLCLSSTTKAIISPMKYLNGIYLVEIQWNEQNFSTF